MERIQEVWPVPDLQKRPDAMEAATAGAAVPMRILDSSREEEARRRPTPDGEKNNKRPVERQAQQRMAPRRHEDQAPPTSGTHALMNGGHQQLDPKEGPRQGGSRIHQETLLQELAKKRTMRRRETHSTWCNRGCDNV
ncbi:hypothetical protein L596_021580 [Steinernema carpocapsae]|uniref:Uncharacterized protein n=1 Tax=Steinernema carpocapsae TaxID=34508 RepID=A0A4V5ZZZ9_STECR|nr:hypothetical protein L596_021580 [Steinernema carpocapsae]